MYSIIINIKRSSFLGLSLFLFFSEVQSPQSPTRAIASTIHTVQNEAMFQGASIGCYAVNITQNKVITDINGTKSFIPASTLKLLTTAAALDTLGKDHRFKTTIQYDGEIDEEGTLHGNIYIKGGGDPALGSRNFQDQYYKPYFIDTWVQAIQEKGINKVTGSVIGDASIYTDEWIIPDTWCVGDLGEYYSAGVDGLSIFDNICSISLQATQKGEEVSPIDIAPPLTKEVKIVSQVRGTAIDDPQVDISGFPDSAIRVMQGEIPCDGRVVIAKSTIPDPAHWAAYTLNQALQEQCIDVAQPPTIMRRSTMPFTVRKDLYTTLSPPLSEIILTANHESVNNYVEHFLRHLSLAAVGQGDILSGTQVLKQFWSDRGVDVSGMLLHDGSGLSRYNALTPKQLVEVLRYMKSSHHFALFYDSLPIAGETGNLVIPFSEASFKGKLRAKSGTLSHVRGFAGYCTNQGGDEVAFAVIVNYYDGSRSGADKAIERILEAFIQ